MVFDGTKVVLKTQRKLRSIQIGSSCVQWGVLKTKIELQGVNFGSCNTDMSNFKLNLYRELKIYDYST